MHLTGPIEYETGTDEKTAAIERGSLILSKEVAEIDIGFGSTNEHGNNQSIALSGMVRHRVHFASTGNALNDILRCISPRSIWIILDEWSEIPLDIQPYLADLIRRSVFHLRNITVTRAPLGLFEVIIDGQEDYIEVSANDYRSIRRAILDIGDYYRKTTVE